MSGGRGKGGRKAGRGGGGRRGRGSGGRGRGPSKGRGGSGASHLPRRYNPKHNFRNLILSCENGNANDVRTLLHDHECSPNWFGSKKPTRVSPGDPLGYYVFRHHRKVKKGRCPRIIVSTDRTPLHICIRKGYVVCARMLVDAGACLDEPGKEDLSATRLMRSMRPAWKSWWPDTQNHRASVEQREASDFQIEMEAEDDASSDSKESNADDESGIVDTPSLTSPST